MTASPKLASRVVREGFSCLHAVTLCIGLARAVRTPSHPLEGPGRSVEPQPAGPRSNSVVSCHELIREANGSLMLCAGILTRLPNGHSGGHIL
ncbi:hypothetical protein GQ53DRAFT_424871 [Thozetella sp. PMI_491]|nr:hypothetical protein GQ53DRAFT_424871 [Thozetella sp. PMI_491]